MSSSTCARSGGGALFAIYKLYPERGVLLRQALTLQQLESDLIFNKIEPRRAHFMARLIIKQRAAA